MTFSVENCAAAPLHDRSRKKSNRDFHFSPNPVSRAEESSACIVKAQHIINRRLFFCFSFFCVSRSLTLVRRNFIYRKWKKNCFFLLLMLFVAHLHIIPIFLITFISCLCSWLGYKLVKRGRTRGRCLLSST